MMNSDDAAKIKIEGIEFPVALLDALRERRLVVFAGAGVSRGKPACLPDFKRLAREVAKGTGEKLKDGENPSLFLDRLADAGVKVHERAAEFLRHDSMPTETHKNLLLLFQKYDPVRIVTTNFDLYFEKAVATENLFNSEVESYRAPALPLGSDFDGIVHVHGSVKRANDMVLTDTDFGKAYLTDGSARRFLRAAFANYTILFVGYSHNDTILNYLARALPPTDQKRFALIPKKSETEHWDRLKTDQKCFAQITDNSETEHWDRLKIVRIEYPISGNDYQALHIGIHALKEFVNRRPTEWKNEIERIVKKSPDDLGDNQNLLEFALKEKTHVASFTNAAKSPEWLDWVDKRDYIDRLYDPNKMDSTSGLWMHWLFEKFAVRHADSLQYVIGRREGLLHYYLWERLSSVIRSADLDENSLRKWVSLLLSKIPDSDGLSWEMRFLAKHCADHGLVHAAAQIFDTMLKTRLSVENYMKDMQLQDLETTWELDFNRIRLQPLYEGHYSCELWEECLKPNIDQFVKLLIDLVVRRLEERHFTFSRWGAANKYFDKALETMKLIEFLSLGSPPLSDIEILTICVARDCLAWLIKNRREDGVYWQRQLAKSESPLLRALAVHSIRMDKSMSSKKKAAWLLEANPLLEMKRINDWAPRKELYALAKQIYPRLNKKWRRAMIEAVGEYRFRRPDRDPNEKLDESDRYDWYDRLHRAYPKCKLAKQRFEKAKSDRLDLDKQAPPTSTINRGDPQDSDQDLSIFLSVDELLEKTGSEWVSELVGLFNRIPRIWDPHDQEFILSDTIKDAAKTNFEWGIELAYALADAGEWETKAWSGLILAWLPDENLSIADIDAEKRQKILKLLGEENLYETQKERDHQIVRALEEYANYYVDEIVSGIEYPITNWIPEFFKHSNNKSRRKFTERLGWYILSDNKSNLLKWWDQWLESYWKNRLQGVPKPLDADEIGHMLLWPLYFGPYMPEAVDLAVQMKPYLQDEIVEAGILFELNKPEIWSYYPKATSKLLLHFSKIPLGPGPLANLHSRAPEIIDNLLTCDLPEKLKSDLEDLRATLS